MAGEENFPRGGLDIKKEAKAPNGDLFKDVSLMKKKKKRKLSVDNSETKQLKNVKKQKFEWSGQVKHENEQKSSDMGADLNQHVLFSKSKNEKGGWKKSKKKGNTEKKKKPSNMNTKMPVKEKKVLVATPYELITKHIRESMLILGYVKEISDTHIMMALPNGRRGQLPITNISDGYLECLRKYSEMIDGDMQTIHSLSDLFTVGTLLPCKVTDVSRTTIPQLSVNPKLVNEHRNKDSLIAAPFFYGSISGQEDNGYLIETGVEDFHCFLKNKDAKHYIQNCNGGERLKIGQCIRCKVLQESKKNSLGTKKYLPVTIDPDEINKADLNPSVNMSELVPGMRVNVEITHIDSEGLTVSCVKQTGFVHFSQLPKQLSTYTIGQQIECCVLYINHGGQTVSLTALPHIVNYTGEPVHLFGFGTLCVGRYITNAKVSKVKPKGVFFKLEGKARGFAKTENINENEEYTKGDLQRCIVTSIDCINNKVQVSLKMDTIKELIRPQDLIGEIVTCTVKSVGNRSIVTIWDKLEGFINRSMMSTDTEITEGQEINCRVLRTYDGVLKLSNMKSVMESTSPVITQVDQLDLGQDVECFAHIRGKILVALFYGSLYAVIMNRQKEHLHDLTNLERINCTVKRFRHHKLYVTIKEPMKAKKEDSTPSYVGRDKTGDRKRKLSEKEDESEKKKEKVDLERVTECIEIPNRCKGTVIGAGGKNVREIGIKTSTKIHIVDVDGDSTKSICQINGFKEGVKKAIVCVEKMVQEMEASTIEVKVPILNYQKRLIDGPRRRKIQMLEQTTKTLIDIRKKNVVISGAKDDVEQARLTVLELIDPKNKNVRVKVPILEHQKGLIIGPKGKVIQMLQQTTKTLVYVKKNNVVISGAKDDVELARLTVLEFINPKMEAEKEDSTLSLSPNNEQKLASETKSDKTDGSDGDNKDDDDENDDNDDDGDNKDDDDNGDNKDDDGDEENDDNGDNKNDDGEENDNGDKKDDDGEENDDDDDASNSSDTEKSSRKRKLSEPTDEKSPKKKEKVTKDIVKVEITVPSQKIGCVVGKGGCGLLHVTKNSGARIRSKKQETVGGDQIFCISGTEDAVKEAQRLIENRIEENGVFGSETIQEEYSIPIKLMGKVVGKKGATIKGIQEKSGARLMFKDTKIDDVNKMCVIIGTNEAVKTAQEMLNTLLQETEVIDSENISEEFSIPMKLIGKVIGKKGATINSIRDKSGARITLKDNEIDCANKLDGTYKLCVISGTYEAVKKAQEMLNTLLHETELGNVKSETHEEMIFSNELTGKLLGKKGQTIQDIVKKSGAKVHIKDGEAKGPDRLCTISGTPSAVEKARKMIKNLLESSTESDAEADDREVKDEEEESDIGEPADSDIDGGEPDGDIAVNVLVPGECVAKLKQEMEKTGIQTTQGVKLTFEYEEEDMEGVCTIAGKEEGVMEVKKKIEKMIKKLQKKSPKKSADKPTLQLTDSISWDTEFKMPNNKDADSSSEDESAEKPVKKTKQQIRKEKQEEEKRLHEYEMKKLEGEVVPETADDFDRLVVTSPDSSVVWLRYMAFHLETSEIDKAREVAERALKTISFREDREKQNVWVAYLNLENMYGTKDLLSKVLSRAIQYCEPLDIYLPLANIYIESNKIVEAESIYSTVVKKYSGNKMVWAKFGEFYFQQNRAESARNLLQRSLKALETRDHVETITKFAQLEFKYGEPERGKTMFENILSTYPKRTDIWAVYVDLLTKLKDHDATRAVYRKMISQKLQAKKIKFFFKKYLEFEEKYGTETQAEEVKKKALEFVELGGIQE